MIRKFVWNSYDHLGAGVILNLAWFVASIPWLAATWWGATLLIPELGALGFVTIGAAGLASAWLNPASLTVLFCAASWADYQNVSPGEAWRFFRQHLLTGFFLSLAAGFAAVLLGVNAAFYLRMEQLPLVARLLLAGTMAWAQIGVLMVCFWVGLMYTTVPSSPLWSVLRSSTLLALRHPVRSAAMGLATAATGALLTVTQVGLPLAAMSISAVFAATAKREFLRRLQNCSEGDGEEPRTWRDLLKPWEMNR